MKAEIVKLDMAQYGLEENKATEIKNLYLPMIKILSDMEEAFNTVVKKEITTELSFEARDLRLKIAKVRTDADKARIGAKAEYLRANNAIQGAYNAVLYVTKTKEEKLLAIEKHQERIEAERKVKLKEERELALVKYEVETEHIKLGEMSLEVWKTYFEGVKAQYENKIAAEKKVEAERVAKENAEREEQERIRKENEQLKAEKAKKEKEADAETKAREERVETFKTRLLEEGYDEINDSFYKKAHTVTSEQLLKLTESEFNNRITEVNVILKKQEEAEVKQKALEEKARKEREIAAEKARKEREEAEAKAKKEKAAKEKVEAELQAKKDAEIKAEADKQEAIEAELSASDKDKFQSLIFELTLLKTKYSFKSKTYQELQEGVNMLIAEIITFSDDRTKSKEL